MNYDPALDQIEEQIGSLLSRETAGTVGDSAAAIGHKIHLHVANAIESTNKQREPHRLWASDIGEKCDRKLWFEVNNVPSGEVMPPAVYIKFLYGNIIEELVLGLMEQVGYDVSHQQERVEYTAPNGVVVSGRLDAKVNGSYIDVKSASTMSYRRYTREGINTSNDTFGYIDQVSFYDLVQGDATGSPGFIWVDKTLGHVKYTPIAVDRIALTRKIDRKSKVIESAKMPDIAMEFEPVPEGKSGNKQLCTYCSYCPFKKNCFSFRTFAYESGPKFLTTVKREPRVPEIR